MKDLPQVHCGASNKFCSFRPNITWRILASGTIHVRIKALAIKTRKLPFLIGVFNKNKVPTLRI